MQKTIITVICIFVILLALMIAENNLVDKYCDNLYKEAKAFKKSLEQSSDAAIRIDSLIDKWEKKKDIIYVFINHNSFNDIETALYNAEYYIKNNDREKALFQSDVLMHRVTELRGSFKFTLGNLL